MSDMDQMTLYDGEGKRLYLTAEERTTFFNASMNARREVRTFCHTLHYTGCRPSEALALSYEHVDLSAKHLVFRTLKKRSKVHHRAIPVPDSLLDSLDMVHGVKEAKQKHKSDRLWIWTRQHAWYLVKTVMLEAGIDTTQPYATVKGLRHSFGVHAISAGVPLNELQKLMGHEDIRTTAIYLEAIGAEKRELVLRMW